MNATTALATGLLASYRAWWAASGPKATQIARAHFDGMCDATHRLGFGMTPTHVHTTVQDAVQAATYQRPAVVPGRDNSAARAYDAEQAEYLVILLNNL